MKRKEKKKRRRSGFLVQLAVGAVIGTALGFTGVYRFFHSAGEGESLLTVFLLLFAAIFLTVQLHELGHLLAGTLTGWRLFSFRVGPLSWNNENGRMKFTWIPNRGYSGLCAMVPPENASAAVSVLYYSGGILVNFLTAAAVYPFLSAGVSGGPGTFLTDLFLMGLLAGGINLFPFYSGNNPTDGMILWSFLFHKSSARRIMEYNRAASQLASGVRPKNLVLGEGLAEPGAAGGQILFFRYLKALDEGDTESARQFAREMEMSIEKLPAPSLPGVYYELCYMRCLAGDPDGAKRFREACRKTLDRDMDANGLRVKAAYAFYAEGDREKALELCGRALSVVPRFPLKGQGILERELVNRLLEEMKRTRNDGNTD
ncbi:M50 family metallopeptidase [Papillibacter cinnamivorans]|uniref:Peptidase M50 domain-containing protein n=1 Tax=Papillibacter cinnamivorans DSM 12816 TaxID=1122930 RepID=A0A1W1ZR18_9FIRM|nr:M50 family metallopeptidase [Papillibacter cinnamivorans]SMC50980.1 hypothetical protein SAMN02745168_1317 [Papillibacter cinnamivorans DSM 12816]